MEGVSGGQGISPWSDVDVLTLDLVGQRLDIDQLLLPRCYQNTPYQEHLEAPSLTPNSRFFCLDRSSWVCSDGCLEELRIGRIGEVGTHRSWHSFDTSAEMMIEYQELVTGKGIGSAVSVLLVSFCVIPSARGI